MAIPRKFIVPALPNRPLTSRDEPFPQGEISLRRNRELDLYTNAAHDPALATYDRDYQNSVALSPRFRSHMEGVLELLKAHFPTGARLVEVGCGKGDFLDLAGLHFSATGFDTTYEGDDQRIQNRYLSAGDRIEADVVILRHVLEYLKDPLEFLKMLHGVFGDCPIYIELQDFDWVLRDGSFFDINYERLNFFTQKALRSLFTENVAAGPCFDGQYQYVLADLGRLSETFAGDFSTTSKWEDVEFSALFPNVGDKLQAIESLLLKHGRGYVWGASARGCMFLVALKLRGYANQIAAEIDINPNKVGKFLPGSLVPVHDRAFIMANATTNDLLIISNPAYESEILGTLAGTSLAEIQHICL